MTSSDNELNQEEETFKPVIKATSLDKKKTETRKMSVSLQRKTTVVFEAITLNDVEDSDIVHEPRILTLADIDE